jgi:hypothetical protein
MVVLRSTVYPVLAGEDQAIGRTPASVTPPLEVFGRRLQKADAPCLVGLGLPISRIEHRYPSQTRRLGSLD